MELIGKLLNELKIKSKGGVYGRRIDVRRYARPCFDTQELNAADAVREDEIIRENYIIPTCRKALEINPLLSEDKECYQLSG